MKKTWVKSCVCASICLLFPLIATASSAIFSNLIVFGDSLSDAASLSLESHMKKEQNVGNNYWIHTEGKIGAPISSEDAVSKTRPLWPNALMSDSTLFDVNPNATRYIYPASQASHQGFSPLRYSINYAWASAETGNHYLNDLNHENPYDDIACQTTGAGYLSSTISCVPGVLLQVTAYLKGVGNHPNPRTLIIIWAGGNDIFNNIAKVTHQNKQSSKPILLLKMLNVAYPVWSNEKNDEPLSNPVQNLKQAVKILIQAGVPAQNIYVINMPNLANTPAAQEFTKGNKTMLYALTVITEIFNTVLRVNLAFDLPNGNIISASKEFNEIVKNHQKYGFDKLFHSCVQDNAAPDCQGYVFLNGKHPTTEVHRLLANYLKDILNARKQG
jgi:phospholipase/lecithinase/hemolysin